MEQVGTHDLRYEDVLTDGFCHVVLYDADDHDRIVVNEDDLVALRDRLNKTITEHKLNDELMSAVKQAYGALVGTLASDDSVVGQARLRLKAALGFNRQGIDIEMPKDLT